MLYEGGRFTKMMNKSTFRKTIRLFCLLSFTLIVIVVEREWLVVLPAALLHEGGHFLAARLCGAETKGLRFDLLGARMEVGGLLSYGKEFTIACGGPLMNLLCAAALYKLQKQGLVGDSQAASLFLEASLGLGLLNLIPVGTMDGGRMLSAALSALCSPTVAAVCLKITTTLCLLMLWLLAAYALLRGSPVISLFIFVLILLFRYTKPDGKGREV